MGNALKFSRPMPHAPWLVAVATVALCRAYNQKIPAPSPSAMSNYAKMGSKTRHSKCCKLYTVVEWGSANEFEAEDNIMGTSRDLKGKAIV